VSRVRLDTKNPGLGQIRFKNTKCTRQKILLPFQNIPPLSAFTLFSQLTEKPAIWQQCLPSVPVYEEEYPQADQNDEDVTQHVADVHQAKAKQIKYKK